MKTFKLKFKADLEYTFTATSQEMANEIGEMICSKNHNLTGVDITNAKLIDVEKIENNK